jgi:O-antigen/teichoic acid export membrane protein
MMWGTRAALEAVVDAALATQLEELDLFESRVDTTSALARLLSQSTWLVDLTLNNTANAAAPLAVTALAMLFNSMMSIPFSLAIGTGLTWLPLWTNGLGVVLLLPLTFWSVGRYGIVGGAISWLAFNLLYFFIVPHVLFRHVLRGEKWRWYLRDTGPFIVLVLALFAGARWAAGPAPSHWAVFGWVVSAGGTYLAVCLAAFPDLRSLVARLPGLRPLRGTAGAPLR